MKKLFIYAVAMLCLFATAGAETNYCNSETPGWGANLGRVTFHSRGHNVVIQGTGANAHIRQTWSGAVTATNCQKTIFDGGHLRHDMPLNADCRSNPNFPGDLFSWCAIYRFADVLCPYPWRVPTQQDFIDLDRAMGGSGNDRNSTLSFITENYINRWYGAFGGTCNHYGARHEQGRMGIYWSQSKSETRDGSLRREACGMHFSRGGQIWPTSGDGLRGDGRTLRCVR